MLETADSVYIQLLLAPLAECARYRPSLGQEGDLGVDLLQFRAMYGEDPLYHWVGLDSDLVYAAHKAAGGMTSLYRQLGIGCERLLRRIVQDALALSAGQVVWSYEYDRGDGRKAIHTLDARIGLSDIQAPASQARVRRWIRESALWMGMGSERADSLEGVVLEIRQGYKSADSKRQNADLRFGLRAYADANLLPVILIVSTQASESVCRRYRNARILVLRGFLEGEGSTFTFFRDVIGYDLAAFFERNTAEIRRQFNVVMQQLLDPNV